MNRRIIELKHIYQHFILSRTIQNLDDLKGGQRTKDTRYHADAVNVAADAGGVSAAWRLKGVAFRLRSPF